jgi:hypothetical protein
MSIDEAVCMVFPRQAGLVVAVVVVGVCATLAAHAMASLTEAQYLAPSPRAVTSPLITAPVKKPRTRPDGAELVTRNMFCSTCTAPEPGPGDTFTPDAILVATSIGLEPRASLRTAAVLGSFGIGDDVPGVGKIFAIGFTYVELVDATGRHGRITFSGAPAPPPPPTAAATDPWEGRLTKIDDHTFEVDRSLVRELVSGAAKPGAVRITPIPGDNGQLAGLRFSGVRDGSLPAALGIKNADLITEINGTKITSANVLLDVLAKLDQLNNVEVDGTRAGKPLGITLRLR